MGETKPVAQGLIGDRKVVASLARGVHGRLFPVHGIGSDPILDFVLAGAWFAPVDAYGVHVMVFAQVNDDPLRMQRVVFVSERFGQVRVALPEGLRVTIREARIAAVGTAIVRAAAVGEAVTKGIANGLAQFRAADEVATLVCFVCPM